MSLGLDSYGNHPLTFLFFVWAYFWSLQSTVWIKELEASFRKCSSAMAFMRSSTSYRIKFVSGTASRKEGEQTVS